MNISKRLLAISSILISLAIVPTSAYAQQDITKCATVTVSTATAKDLSALLADADCFGKAVVSASNSQVLRLKKAREIADGLTTAPAPTPTPTPTPTPAPTPDPAVIPGVGLPPIADNFDTNTGVFTNGRGIPAASPDRNGSFRLICLPGVLAYINPVESPPGTPSMHLHQTFGNLGANVNSNYTSLRTSGQSSCENPSSGPVNRSLYGIPAMLNGIGQVVKPDYWHVYYKRNPKSDPYCDFAVSGNHCVDVPPGLKFVAGYDMKTGTNSVIDPKGNFYWMSHWSCVGPKGEDRLAGKYAWDYRTLQQIMDSHLCQLGDNARLDIGGPDCWDGIHVDSADHRSHLAEARTPPPAGSGLPSFVCDSTHPYRFAAPGGFVMWTVDQEFLDGKWLFTSDQMARDMGQTVQAGQTFHYWYIMAWSPTVQEKWESNCEDKHLSCNMGELGDGTQMNILTTPRPTHVVVPIPPKPQGM